MTPAILAVWALFLTGLSLNGVAGQTIRSAVIYHNTDVKCTSYNELPPLVCINESVIRIKQVTFGGNHMNPQCARCDQSAQCRKAGLKKLSHPKTLALYQACSGKTSCVDYLSLFDGDNVWTEYRITYECVPETRLIDVCSTGTYGPRQEVHFVYDRIRSSVPPICSCSVTSSPKEQVDIALTDVRLSSDITQCGNTLMRFQQGQYEIAIDCKKNAGYLGVQLPVAYKKRSSENPPIHVQLRNVSIKDPPQRFWVSLTSKGPTMNVTCNMAVNLHNSMAALAVNPDKDDSSKLGVSIGVPVAVVLVVVVVAVLLVIAHRRGFLPFSKKTTPKANGTNNNDIGPPIISQQPVSQQHVCQEPTSDVTAMSESSTVIIPVKDDTIVASVPSSPRDKTTMSPRPHKAPPPPPLSPPRTPVTPVHSDKKTDNDVLSTDSKEPQSCSNSTESGMTLGDGNGQVQNDQCKDSDTSDQSNVYEVSLDDANSETDQMWNQALANQARAQDSYHDDTALDMSDTSGTGQDVYSHIKGGTYSSDKDRALESPENVYSHINTTVTPPRPDIPKKPTSDTNSAIIKNNNNVTYISVKNSGAGNDPIYLNNTHHQQQQESPSIEDDNYNRIWEFVPSNGESIDTIEDTGDSPMVEAYL